MYTCLECGEIFEVPKSYTERHGLDIPPYETLLCCPYCQGDYEDARQCDVCGKWFSSDEWLYNGYCSSCVDESYTANAGLRFLEVMDLEEEFYLSVVWRVPKVSRFNIKRLVDLYREEFIRELENDKYLSDRRTYERELRVFCLRDYIEWVDYLINDKKQLQPTIQTSM